MASIKKQSDSCSQFIHRLGLAHLTTNPSPATSPPTLTTLPPSLHPTQPTPHLTTQPTLHPVTNPHSTTPSPNPRSPHPIPHLSAHLSAPTTNPTLSHSKQSRPVQSHHLLLLLLFTEGATSIMFSLSPESRFLLQASGQHLSLSQQQQLNPIRLASRAFTVFGRLESLQGLSSDLELIANIQAISVQEALTKAQAPPRNSPRPSGTIADTQRLPAKTKQELDEIARKAKNPFWLSEMRQFVATFGDDSKQFCKYIMLNDPLHPNR